MGSLTATTTTTNMKGPMKACRQVIGFNPCPPFHHYRTAASDIHNNEGVGGLLSISTINSTTTAASRSGNRPYDPVSPCSRRSGLQALLAADKSPPTSPPPPPQPIISSSSSSSSSSSAGTLPISSNTVGASCSKPAMASSSSSSRSVISSCSKSAIVISPPPSVRTSLYSCNTAGLNCSKPTMVSSSSSSSSLSVGTLQNSHKTTVASCSKPAMAISSASASSHSSSSPHSAGTLPASCRTSGVTCKSPAAIASSSSHGCHSRKTSFFFISTPDAFLTDSIDVYLGACFLCKRHLPSTEDIFIYRGERAFCSEDCRSKHRFMNRKEEEEEEKTSEEFTKLIIQRIVGYQNRSKRLTERAAAA